MNSNKQKPSLDLILMYPEGIKKKNKVILAQRRLCVCVEISKKPSLWLSFPSGLKKKSKWEDYRCEERTVCQWE